MIAREVFVVGRVIMAPRPLPLKMLQRSLADQSLLRLQSFSDAEVYSLCLLHRPASVVFPLRLSVFWLIRSSEERISPEERISQRLALPALLRCCSDFETHFA